MSNNPFNQSAKSLCALFIILGTTACFPASLPFKPATIFADNMILQREMPIPVWGWDTTGKTVTVTFAGQTKTAVTDTSGKWLVKFDPVKVADSLVMTVSDGSKTFTLRNIGVGEVWLCSGQSNMWLPLYSTCCTNSDWNTIYKDTIAAANYPRIRQFNMDTANVSLCKTNLATDVNIGEWEMCAPATVGKFSAVGYFFARALYRSLGVPIGIIHNAVGATAIESWTSYSSLSTVPALKSLADSQISVAKKALAAGQHPDLRYTATCNFNALINPILPYAIRGVAWYQGESNLAQDYHSKMALMMQDWRASWNQGNFPFHIVQLCNYSNGEFIWLREEQLASVKNNPNMGLAVTIDVGEVNMIHPTDKWDVGYRLALNALARTYGKDIVYSGPIYKSMKISGSTATLTFSHKGSGLMAKGGASLKGFLIAGANLSFTTATATIVGDSLVTVSSPSVSTPVAVRYAIISDPLGAGCNLYNKEDLPASPFRTDLPVSLKGTVDYYDDWYDAFSRTEAEFYHLGSGYVQTTACSDSGESGQTLSSIHPGDWTAFMNMNFGTGANSFQARVSTETASSAGSIEVRLDGLTGMRIGTLDAPGRGGWNSYKTVSCAITKTQGIHDVYLVFASAGYNVNWFRFDSNQVSVGALPVAGSRDLLIGQSVVEIYDLRGRLISRNSMKSRESLRHLDRALPGTTGVVIRKIRSLRGELVTMVRVCR